MPTPIISPQLEERLSTLYQTEERVPIYVFVAGWPPDKVYITREDQILAIKPLETYLKSKGYVWTRNLPDGPFRPGWPGLTMSLIPYEVRSLSEAVYDNGSPLIAAVNEDMWRAKETPKTQHSDM